MGLALITNTRLHDRIEDELIDLIVSEDFRPGDRLPSERDIARTLGVGRGSLRQAVVALELDGILEVRTSSGIYVASNGLAEVYRRPAGSADVPPLDVIHARRAVEGEAAALAAGHASEDAIADIALVQERFKSRDGRYDLRHPADRGFHVAIAEASGNRALAALVVDLWEMQRGRLYERMEDHFSTAAMRDDAIRDHDRILAALQGRGPAGARAAMHRHMDRIYANLAHSSSEPSGKPPDEPPGESSGDGP